MDNFFDIQFDESLRIEDYLSGIENPVKKHATLDLLKPMEGLFEFIKNRNKSLSSSQAPEIRVTQEEIPNAEAMEGIIRVSSGLLDHCLNTKYIIDKSVFSEEIDFVFAKGHISKSMFIWVISHEYYHIVRKHNDVIAKHGSDVATHQAVEYDADLCAIAVVFRLIQKSLKDVISIEMVKQLTLFSVFWSIRVLPNHSNRAQHLPIEERIYHILSKLAMLSEHEEDDPDVSCERPETKRNIGLLVNCLHKIENNIHALYPKEFNFHLMEEFSEIVRLEKYRAVLNRWDEIRESVSELSGTRA